MSKISGEAIDLLKSLKRVNKRKIIAGDYIDKRTVCLDYGLKQNSKELDPLFAELANNGYIKYESGAYRLLAKALNQDSVTNHSTNIFSGVFTQSTIANMSSDIRQTLDLSNYSIEIQNEVAELQEAIRLKDDTSTKRIIDGLWISAPQLVLNLLQVGLAAYGVSK